MSVLPDVLRHDLDIVFCGTAPGSVSGAKRAYYAGPGNAFWPTLFAVGLTSRQLRPCEFAQVDQWNLGLTDLAKEISGSDATLSRNHFDAGRLHAVIAQFRPRLIAFTSKRAAVEFVGHGVDYGLCGQSVGATGLYVLPSPSGAARRYWDPAWWRGLSRFRSSDS